MNQEVHVLYHLEVTADTEGDHSLYTTPKGWDLVIEGISVAFPPESDFELEVSFYDGIRAIAPTQGVFVGKGMAFNTVRKIRLEEGATIRLHYKNTHAHEARHAVIEVVGVLKSE